MGKLQIKGKSTDRIYIPVKYVSHYGKERKVDTIVDTGSNISYIGISHIKGLKYQVDLNKLTLNNLIGMYGITGAIPSPSGKQPKPKPDEKIYASWAVNLKSIILDDIIINCPQVYIPVSFCFSGKQELTNIQFEKSNLALLGTDILRNFNYGVNINSTPIFTITKPTRNIPPRCLKITHLDFENT